MYVCMHIDGRVMLSAGEVKGNVLANTTSIGMHPHTDASPASASAVGSFELVFDAVYTPMDTTLLKVCLSACVTLRTVQHAVPVCAVTGHRDIEWHMLHAAAVV